MSQNRMYTLEGRKDEGLLIMGKKEPKGHCVGPRNIYKYLHLPDRQCKWREWEYQHPWKFIGRISTGSW